MRRTSETEGASQPKPRKRLVMTEADWSRVERDVRRAEHEPDPGQIPLLPDMVKGGA